MKKLNNILEIQEFISIANETYIVEPYREEPRTNSRDEKSKQVESFAHNKSKRKELIDAFTKLKDHPKAEDLGSDVGYAFDENEIEDELGPDIFAAYEAVGENGIIYSEISHSFWIHYEDKLIRIM